MFENIGNTIKIMAKVLWWIGTITIIGILIIWPSAFILYGFGELITQTTNIAKGNKRIQMLSVCNKDIDTKIAENKTVQQIRDEVMEEYEEENTQYIDEETLINEPKEDECPCCFSKINVNDNECSYCGYKLK